MTCNITGTAYLPDGSVASRRQMTFWPKPVAVAARDGNGILPDGKIVNTAADGAVDFNLTAGAYLGVVFISSQPVSFAFNVPDQASATFSDCLINAEVDVDSIVAFARIAVAGQDSVAATGSADTLTLVAGTNVTLTTDEDAKTVTISAGDGAATAWGGIVGTLSAQTDLQAALDAKQAYSAVLAATTASYTSAEQTKLAGIASGATANSSDATLLARANHTGTQTASTISDFASGVIAAVLTGFAAAGSRTAVAATDTILAAFGKVQKYLNDLATVAFSGAWSDLSGKPTTVSGAGLTDAVTLTGTQTLQNKTLDDTNSITVKANALTIEDPTDTTKKAILSVSQIASGTTRTITIPNISLTVCGIGSTQTLTNKTIDLGSNTVTMTKAQLNAAVTDGDPLYVGDITGVTFVSCVLQSDYTLTSTTSFQKAFNSSANGAVALSTGVWLFEWDHCITGETSATSNHSVDILGAGTATLARILFQSIGGDTVGMSTIGPAAAGGLVANTTYAPNNGSGGTNGNGIVPTTSSATSPRVMIRGVFDVTVAGTIIPSVALTAAAAAVMVAGSWFRATRISASATATVGTWT